MSDDLYSFLYVLITLPLFAVGVGGLAVCWLRRRQRPTAAKLFAVGLGLLLGGLALDAILYHLFPLHEWVGIVGIDVQLAYLLTAVFRQIMTVGAALLVIAAVFVEDGSDRDRPR